MRHPGLEPGPPAWKAGILTTGPIALPEPRTSSPQAGDTNIFLSRISVGGEDSLVRNMVHVCVARELRVL